MNPLFLQLLANLFGLAIALYMSWSPAMIILLFWAENIVTGLWQLPRFYIASGETKPIKTSARIFTSIFFLFHYGFFTFVHGIFVLALFFQQAPEPAAFIRVISSQHGLTLALLGMLISHGAQFFNALNSGQLAQMSLNDVMSEPYRRIVVLHLVIIGSGLLLSLAPGHATVALILLALIKSIMDYRNDKHLSAKQESPHVT